MALPATDSFTGSNGTALPTHDSNWVERRGSFAINTNAVYIDAGSGVNDDAVADWSGDTFDNDQYSQIKKVASTGSGYTSIGVVARSSASGGYTLEATYNVTLLGKWTVGGDYWTQIGSDGGACAVNSVLRLEVEGTTLRPQIDDVLISAIGEQTDATFSSGAAGLYGYLSSTSCRGDDWEGGNLALPAIMGSATIPVNFGVSATGAVLVQGAATIAVDFGVSATGTVGTPAITGSATIPVDFGVSATGTVLVQGAAIIPVDFGVSATGAVLVQGAATIAVDFGVSATGTVGDATISGSATILVAFGVSATGTVTGVSQPYASWEFLVDWDGDGDFSESYEEITDYVRNARWRLGMRKPFQSLADKTECTLLLKNHDGRFTPENPASPYLGEMLPGRLLEIRCTFYGVTRTMWRGYLEDVQPFGATKRQPDAELRGTDLKGFAQKKEVRIPLLVDVTADEALLEIFMKLPPPPGTWAGNWIIGRPGLSELGVSTYLADLDDFYNLEVGTITLPYVGDRWEDGVDAYRAALDVVAAERGRLFTARDGRLTFWNRQHTQLLYTPDATIDNEMADMAYAYGKDIANKIIVNTTPRKLTTDATLWTMDDETTIPAGEEKTIRATYKAEDSDASISGKDVITPNKADGSLVVEGTVAITVEEKARGADVIVRNTGSREATITTLILKGTALTSFNKRETVSQDDDSINVYGEAVEKLNSDLLSDEDFAVQLGNYELHRRAQPRGVVYDVTLQNRSVALYTTMLGLTMGSLITVQEDTLYHNKDYIVIGEEHTLSDGMTKHNVTLNLEIGDASAYWLVGVTGRSEIGETTLLGL